MIFVFGSNEAGRHGAGAALTALCDHGAEYGKGYGHYGESFAIPTLGKKLEPIPFKKIEYYVHGFLAYAYGRDDMIFQVSRIGCGLAGMTDAEMAPLFEGASSNCQFDTAWKPWLGEDASYWGTF